MRKFLALSLAAVIVAVSSPFLALAGASYSWTPKQFPTQLQEQHGQMVISGDGNHIAVVMNGDEIGVKISDDNGSTWTMHEVPAGDLYYLGISYDGTHLITSDYGDGDVFYSVDSGDTWNEVTALNDDYWTNVAVSADGTHMAVISECDILCETTTGAIWLSNDSGATWNEVTTAGDHAWVSIALSQDGSNIAAASYYGADGTWDTNGYLYTSDDGGATWTEHVDAGERRWADIVISSDGSHLAATENTGDVVTSTNGGATWTEQAGISNAVSTIGSSADGGTLAIVTISNYLYISTDYGVTWDQEMDLGTMGWNQVSVSGDGTHIVLGTQSNGDNFLSTDSGVTWNDIDEVVPSTARWNQAFVSSDNMHLTVLRQDGTELSVSADGGETWETRLRDLTKVAVSSDGSHMVGMYSGQLYTSDDYGENWTLRDQIGNSDNFRSVAISADGSRMYGSENNGYIYTSDDYGDTWTELTASGDRHWNELSVSADGSRLIATVRYNDGHYAIFTSEDYGATVTERTGVGDYEWWYTASSADGSHLAVTSFCDFDCNFPNGILILSTDYGATWTEQTGIGRHEFEQVAMSEDGQTILVATDAMEEDDSFSTPDYVYTSQDGGATWKQETSIGDEYWLATALSGDGTIAIVGGAETNLFIGRLTTDEEEEEEPVVSHGSSGHNNTKKEQLEEERDAQEDSMDDDSPASSSGSTPALTAVRTVTRDLFRGVVSDEVKKLQLFLMGAVPPPTSLPLIAAGATGYFGPLTQAALAAYQTIHGIVPAAGYFGPITRSYIERAATSALLNRRYFHTV